MLQDAAQGVMLQALDNAITEVNKKVRIQRKWALRIAGIEKATHTRFSLYVEFRTVV